MESDDRHLDEEASESSHPRKRGRKKEPKEFKLDKDSKNRIRKTPDIYAFYEMVSRYQLRDDVYKMLVLNSLSELEAKRVKKQLLSLARTGAQKEAAI